MRSGGEKREATTMASSSLVIKMGTKVQAKDVVVSS